MSAAGGCNAMDETESGPDEPPQRSPHAAQGAAIELVDATGRLGAARCRAIEAGLGRCLAAAGARGELRVRVVGDDEMAALHMRTLAQPGPTDVLSFDLADSGAGMGAGTGAGGLDCDAVVCQDVAQRRVGNGADAATVDAELVLYALHAALHCLGHDDRDEAASARMHAEEDRLLSEAGYGPVFSRGLASGGGA